MARQDKNVENNPVPVPHSTDSMPGTDGGKKSYLNGVLARREVDGTLALLVGGLSALVLGKTATDLTGELGAEIERKVLLVLVEETQLSALVGVDDSENASDRLANLAAKMKNSSQHSDLEILLKSPVSYRVRKFPVVDSSSSSSYRSVDCRL